MPNLYVPILKGKEGEFGALESLHSEIKPNVIPLIEIPDTPFDHAAGTPAKTLPEHIKGVPERLYKAWQQHAFYLETPYFGTNDLIDGERCALESLLTSCERKGATPFPVLRTNSSQGCIDAVSSRPNTTACIRLVVDDFSEDTDTESIVNNLLVRIGRATPANMDLLVDLGELTNETSTSIMIARSILAMVPRVEEWNRIILSASSFPEDLSGVGSKSIATLPRREWQLWEALHRKASLLPHQLFFSDYAISHPLIKGIDPRVMRMSASIRYTTPTNWLIVKGRNVNQYGFEQYFDLCEQLVGHPSYAGENFSWGDRFISNCAHGIEGPGNATTWRKVGVNHHVTLVTHQLSNAPST